MSDNGVKKLVEYLFDCRADYVRMCGLDEDRVVSSMPNGKKYLSHCIRKIRLRGEHVPPSLEKQALKLFLEKEREVVKKE